MAKQLSDTVEKWSQGRKLAAELARTTVTSVPIADGGAEHTFRWRAWFVGFRVWDYLLNYEGRSESEIRDAAKTIDTIIESDNEELRQDEAGPLDLNNFTESGDLQTESEWLGDVHDLYGLDDRALTVEDPFIKLLNQLGLNGWQRWEIQYLLALRMIDDAIRHYIAGKNDLAETLLVKALDETYMTEIVAHGQHRNTEHLSVKHTKRFEELERQCWVRDAKPQLIKERQSEIARKPRGDALTQAIREFALAHPYDGWKELLKFLLEHPTLKCNDVDGILEWSTLNGDTGDAQLSGLSARLSRARQKQP